MTLGPVAILGSSATGLSLALACAAAGISVSVVEKDPDARERAQIFARKDDPALAEKVVFHADTNALVHTQLIFDALDPDDRDAGTLLVPKSIAIATPYAEPLSGMPKDQQVRCVPFQPMQLRHLFELTRFPETGDDTIRCWQTLAQAIGRVPVELPLGTPSIGLRLQDRLHAQADHLLLHGAVLWELDEAMTSFGFDLGFYEAQDLTGLDVAYARRKARGQPSLIADRAVEEGRIGKKIGWGWYRYPGGGGAVIDPLIEDLIREEAWFAKVEQQSFDPGEMTDQLLQVLQEELDTIRREMSVGTAEDLGKIVVHGLGYPESKLNLLGL